MAFPHFAAAGLHTTMVVGIFSVAAADAKALSRSAPNCTRYHKSALVPVSQSSVVALRPVQFGINGDRQSFPAAFVSHQPSIFRWRSESARKGAYLTDLGGKAGTPIHHPCTEVLVDLVQVRRSRNGRIIGDSREVGVHSIMDFSERRHFRLPWKDSGLFTSQYRHRCRKSNRGQLGQRFRRNRRPITIGWIRQTFFDAEWRKTHTFTRPIQLANQHFTIFPRKPPSYAFTSVGSRVIFSSS